MSVVTYFPTEGYPHAMTNAVADERRRLRERLGELDAERGHISYTLAVLDRLAPGEVQPATRRHARAGRRKTKTGHPGGTLDRAVRAITSSGRAWRVDELVSAMRDDGWSANVANETETVRSALSRAVRDGLVDRVGQGLYAPKDHQGTAAGGDDGQVPVGTDDGAEPVADPWPPRPVADPRSATTLAQ